MRSRRPATDTLSGSPALRGSDFADDAAWFAARKELRERCAGIHAEGVTDFSKLDDVQSTLAALDFRDKGLCVAQAPPQLDLSHAGLLAEVAEHAQQQLVVAVVCRACHVVAVVRQRTLESDSE